MSRDTAIANAAGLADSISRTLHLAASGTLAAEVRQRYARMAWTAWPQLCRAMSDLEGHMPRSVEAGYQTAERAREIATGAAA